MPGSYDGHLLVFDRLTGESLEGIYFKSCSVRGEAACVHDVLFVVTYTQEKESPGAINMVRGFFTEGFHCTFLNENRILLPGRV